MNADVKELRSNDRYLPQYAMMGTFGAADVSILNVAGNGAQVEHPQPLRLASKARLVSRVGAHQIAVTGVVIWSHLSRMPNDQGKYLYRSGIRFDNELDLGPLAGSGVLRREIGTLDRKRERIIEKERQRAAQPVVKILTNTEVDPDQVLLIHHARERLRAHPDEALKWYNRAKFALVDEDLAFDAATHHREDILAVWEYLERSIDLSTIVRVFERK